MKTTLFAVLMLGLCPVVRAEVATVVSEASPLMENNGGVEILMADGSARRFRKILGMSPDSLRIMTDNGIAKIPLDTLHPQALAKLNSMVESPEEQQARQKKEAAAAQSYREAQALKERMAAEDNAMVAAAQRAEAARQEAARKAAAEAYARQQEYLMEAMKIQEAQRAARKAELAAAERERMRMEEAERQRQHELEVAALQAQQAMAAANAAQQQQYNVAAQAGPLASMMPGQIRVASGVDKLDITEQRDLKNWVTSPSMRAPLLSTWKQKLDLPEREVLAAWLNKKRVELNPSMAGGYAPNPPTVPSNTWMSGRDFTGFQKGRVYKLADGQSWRQIDDTAASYYPDVSGRIIKVYVTANNGSNYTMKVEGAGQILVVPAR